MKPNGQQTLRLDKWLADMGLGSRKEIKQLVKQNHVQVDGLVVSDPSQHVDPQRQTVVVNGRTVTYRPFIYLMMNKPSGLLSATEDARAATVVDLVAAEYGHYAVFPVGRLDKDSEGLLLLTNDGNLAHRLLSPKRHVDKVYAIRVNGRLTEEDVQAVARPMDLGDFMTLPGRLEILSSGDVSEARMTICEGKFHQVKRMMQTVGKPVVYLQRIAMGPLRLDPALGLGQYRELTNNELEQLQLG